MSFDPVAYINTPRWQASRLGLGRIVRLLELMGRPQDRLRFVHVAGTNGKGSTCAYLESVLRSAGYRTGLFTSPYLEVFEERIRVNGENISGTDLADATLFVKEHAERVEVETGDHPTEFELMTAVAFEHFARSACDIVVLEVGLGGRLDSTNVIDAPEVCVIARVGLDHTALLGDTVAQVAAEKAGIVKAGVPVVSWPQEPEAMRVVEAAAAEKGCELFVPDLGALEVEPLGRFGPLGEAASSGELAISGEDADSGEDAVADALRVAASSGDAGANVLRVAVPRGCALSDASAIAEGSASAADAGASAIAEGSEPAADADASALACDSGILAAFGDAAAEHVSRETFVRKFSYKGREYTTRILGGYQPANAALAIEATRVLGERGWLIPEDAVREGLARAEWPGRFEVVAHSPLTIVDGGHNPQGAQVLAESLKELVSPSASASFPAPAPLSASASLLEASVSASVDAAVSTAGLASASDPLLLAPSLACSSIGALAPGAVFVMGVLADKDYAPMVASVLPLAQAFFTYTPENPRALSAEDLALEVRAQVAARVSEGAVRGGRSVQGDEALEIGGVEGGGGGSIAAKARGDCAESSFCEIGGGVSGRSGVFVEACGSPAEALRNARAAAGEGGLVVAFGSLYSIASLKAALREGA